MPGMAGGGSRSVPGGGRSATRSIVRRSVCAPNIIPRLMTTVRIKDLPQHVGEKVTVNGWLYNKRTSGKLQFPIVRDGSGYLQCVVFKKEVSEETWSAADAVTQE